MCELRNGKATQENSRFKCGACETRDGNDFYVVTISDQETAFPLTSMSARSRVDSHTPSERTKKRINIQEELSSLTTHLASHTSRIRYHFELAKRFRPSTTSNILDVNTASHSRVIMLITTHLVLKSFGKTSISKIRPSHSVELELIMPMALPSVSSRLSRPGHEL